MHFSFSLAFVFLVLPLLLFWLARREEKSIAQKLAALGQFETLKPMLVFFSPQRRFLRRLLSVLSVFFVVLALTGPLIGSETEMRPRQGLDVVFAIDVSKSMRAQDVRPDRLSRAQFEIASFLEQIGENRVGIVAFAGTAFVQCPLTTDMEAIQTFLQALSPELMPQGGTALSDGIQTSLRLFEAQAMVQDEDRKSGRILVLITDGEDHEGATDELGATLKKANIASVVIGLGSELGEPIPLKNESGQMAGYLKDKNGQTVMTRLNTPMLRSLAEKSKGKYIDGLSEPDLGLSYVESLVGSLEKQELQARVQTFYVDRFMWPLGLAILFWILATALSPGGRMAHLQVKQMLLFLAFGFLSAPANAQPGPEKDSIFLRPEPQIEAGIQALKSQDYESALTHFENAPGHTRPQRAIKAYNRAFTLLAQGAAQVQSQQQTQNPSAGANPNAPAPAPLPDPEGATDATATLAGAEQAFQNAYGLSHVPQIRSEAALGLGNARLLQQDLEGAIEAYRDALVAQINNERAKKNLLRALQMKEQQEQQQEQQQDQQQEPGENQDNNDEQNQEQNQEQQQQQEGSNADDADQKEDENKQEQPQPQDEKNKGDKDKDKKAPQPQQPKEEEAKPKSGVRLLDAMREQEKPLAPFQMRMSAPKEPPEKDW